MKLIDADKFLEDLQNECCDVVDADERYPAYSEYGYSYDLIKQVIERQPIIDEKKSSTPKSLEFWYSNVEGSGTDEDREKEKRELLYKLAESLNGGNL